MPWKETAPDMSGAKVRPRLEAHIEWLEAEVRQGEAELRELLRRTPLWREKDKAHPEWALCSVSP